MKSVSKILGIIQSLLSQEDAMQQHYNEKLAPKYESESTNRITTLSQSQMDAIDGVFRTIISHIIHVCDKCQL